MIKVIVLTKSRQRIITKFGRKIKAAKKFKRLIKEMESPHILKVCLIDISEIKHPEKGERRELGKMWCPYCGKQRAFRAGYRGDDYNWCEICGISDADFHVRNFNGLWGGGLRTDTFIEIATEEEKVEEKETKKQKKRERAERRAAARAAEEAKAKRKKK